MKRFFAFFAFGVYVLSVCALVLGLAAPTQAAAPTPPGKVFVINVTIHNNFTLDTTSAQVRAGMPTISASGDAAKLYTARLVSLDNTTLARVHFPLNFTVADNPNEVTVPEVYEVLKLPFAITAKAVEFSRPDGTVFGITNLVTALCSPTSDGQCSEYCAFKAVDPDCFRCGNGVCEPSETVASCPVDCAVATAASAKTTPTHSSNNPLLYAFIMVVLVAAGLFAWQKIKRT